MMPFPMYQTPAPQPRSAPPQAYAPPQHSIQQGPNPYGQNPYSAPAPWQATPSPVLAAQAAQVNQPKVRGYAPEPKAPPAPPRPLQLPSPEDLGLTAPVAMPTRSFVPVAQTPTRAPAAVDWNDTRARLRQMGAVAFTVNQLPDGMTRVILTLPAGQSGQTRSVLAIGTTEAAAVASMFDRIGELPAPASTTQLEVR